MYSDEQFYGLLPPWHGLRTTAVPSHNIHVTGAFLPEIRQTPLSAQPHHLMRSQLRSLGFSPGNWHYLNSQGICRIMKFFKGF